MNAVADILGIPPDLVGADLPTEGGVDESTRSVDPAECAALRVDAARVLDTAQQLQLQSQAFERDIRELSQEMHGLQQLSAGIHRRRWRREQALAGLAPALADCAVPPAVIDAVVQGDIGEPWFAALEWLRTNGTTNKNNDGQNGGSSQAVMDAARIRRVLMAQVVERAKKAYVSKLRMLRRPGVDAQVVQAEIVALRPALAALHEQTPRLAAALAVAYQNTMRWYYHMLYGKYGCWLGRQPLAAVATPKLLGNAASSPLFLSSGAGGASAVGTASGGGVIGAPAASSGGSAFSVGARPSVLRSSEHAVPLLSMTASPPASSPYYPIEVLAHSLFGVVSEGVRAERDVSVNGMVPAWDAERTMQLFEPVLAQYAKLLKNWITQCAGDVFGLLMVVRIAEQTNSHGVEELRAWLDGLAARCWSHIISGCAEQAKSIEQAALKLSNRNAAFPGPHMLTQLVSSYLAGILQLYTPASSDALAKELRQIATAYELFVSKLAAGNEAILYNNYFVMSALLSDIEGPLAQELSSHFQLLVDAYRTK